jgi:hypothetical protein
MTATTDYATEHGKELLKEGMNRLSQAKKLVRAHGATDEARQQARRALVTLRSAMDWLEDTDQFEAGHHVLDRAGAFMRRTFGCLLHQDGDGYQQRCPVALAHNRMGLSPAYIVRKAECSICGKDLALCDHVTGRVYDGQRCFRWLREVELLEVSFVDRPAQPDARIHAISIGTGELREMLGPEFRPGMPVSCDRCLNPCTGLSWPFGGA